MKADYGSEAWFGMLMSGGLREEKKTDLMLPSWEPMIKAQ